MTKFEQDVNKQSGPFRNWNYIPHLGSIPVYLYISILFTSAQASMSIE